MVSGGSARGDMRGEQEFWQEKSVVATVAWVSSVCLCVYVFGVGGRSRVRSSKQARAQSKQASKQARARQGMDQGNPLAGSRNTIAYVCTTRLRNNVRVSTGLRVHVPFDLSLNFFPNPRSCCLLLPHHTHTSLHTNRTI